MNSSVRRAPRKLDAVGAARGWLELGILPVPLRPRSKVPSGGTGWNTLRVTPKTLERFFKKGDNLGGLWGEPSNWIVDVDLDWDEALGFAQHYLPETFTYGRLSRPSSHYLYRVKGAVSLSRVINKEKVVEIRSTGSQSVLPPSMHPDRERYHIDRDAPFTALSKAELERYVSRVAAAAVLIRHFPGEGGRHDYIHSVTGSLMWSGWNEEDTTTFMHALLRCIYVHDNEPKDRQLTVKNTIEHFKKGDRIAGWRILGQFLPSDVVKTLREWLAPQKNYQTPPALVNGEARTLIPALDPMLLAAPGMVGDIAKWSTKRSYLIQPGFDIAVGLMCTALASCNKYIVEGWSTPLQPYLMLLAPTAGGKGSALDSVYDFATRVKMQPLVFQGFQSYFSLLDKLSTPPALACWLWDEAARRLKATRNSASFDYQIITWLLQLYGRANSQVPALPGRKTDVPPLTRPWLGLMAAAQPSQLIESVSISDLAMGLLNRFILFDSGDFAPTANLERIDVFPASVMQKVKQMKEFDPKKIPMAISFDQGVYVKFRDFDDEARRHATAEGDNEIWGRANQNALMVGGIAAVGINPLSPMISVEIAEWAIALVRWGISCWAARIGDSTARTFRERESKTVERYIRTASKYYHRVNPKYRELMKRGLMPYSVLQNLCRHLQSREFSEILEQLTDAQLIGAGEEEGVECYWPLH
jgi:hypothetical protein